MFERVDALDDLAALFENALGEWARSIFELSFPDMLDMVWERGEIRV
jgi:hypothetical protein